MRDNKARYYDTRDYSNRYYGKYKAKVVKIEGEKVKVKCEFIYGKYESPWCVPCIPILNEKALMLVIDGTETLTTTSSDGHTHTVKVHKHKLVPRLSMPKVNEEIWIEFEGGDSHKPIWVGLTSGVLSQPSR